MNYEDLVRLYSNSNSIWNALMTQFMSRDKNDDGVYLHVIDDMMSSINNKGKAICLRLKDYSKKKFQRNWIHWKAKYKKTTDDLVILNK